MEVPPPPSPEVDDTLVLMTPHDVDKVLNKLNSFHKNLRFTSDTFADENVYFLDLRIDGKKSIVYRKDTHTEQYFHILSVRGHRQTDLS